MGTTVAIVFLQGSALNTRYNKGNACYRPVQNILSSGSQSKNAKIKFVIIRVVLLDVKVGLAQRGGMRKLEEYWGLEMISDRLEKTL